ncbi:hypothetical protein AUP68_13892 [Ilyonectria robusta]
MKVFFVAALVSAPVLAQDLTSLPACAQTCALNAISSTGCAPTDAKCICESTSFLSSVESCISTACNATDQQATLTFAQQFCSSAGVTYHAATQATTQTTTGSSTAPIPTTLITTTDSSGNVFTVTGEVLVLGNSSTTVPCRTVITTNAAGVTVTATETGLSVTSTASTAASSSLTALPSIATSTAGAGMLSWLNAVLVSVALSGISVIILFLFE